MSYDICVDDNSNKAVILLRETDEGRAFISSDKFSKVSSASKGKFKEEGDLIKAGFGITRLNPGTLRDTYTYEDSFEALRNAIDFVKNWNKEVSEACVCEPTLNVYNLDFNTNPNLPMNNSSVIAQYEIDNFFTKENLAVASSTLKDLKDKSSSIARVIESLNSIQSKLNSLVVAVNTSADNKDVSATQKSLEKSVKVIEAFNADENLKLQVTIGKTKLEEELKDFDAKAFLKD